MPRGSLPRHKLWLLLLLATLTRQLALGGWLTAVTPPPPPPWRSKDPVNATKRCMYLPLPRRVDSNGYGIFNPAGAYHHGVRLSPHKAMSHCQCVHQPFYIVTEAPRGIIALPFSSH